MTERPSRPVKPIVANVVYRLIWSVYHRTGRTSMTIEGIAQSTGFRKSEVLDFLKTAGLRYRHGVNEGDHLFIYSYSLDVLRLSINKKSSKFPDFDSGSLTDGVVSIKFYEGRKLVPDAATGEVDFKIADPSDADNVSVVTKAPSTDYYVSTHAKATLFAAHRDIFPTSPAPSHRDIAITLSRVKPATDHDLELIIDAVKAQAMARSIPTASVYYFALIGKSPDAMDVGREFRKIRRSVESAWSKDYTTPADREMISAILAYNGMKSSEIPDFIKFCAQRMVVGYGRKVRLPSVSGITLRHWIVAYNANKNGKTIESSEFTHGNQQKFDNQSFVGALANYVEIPG